MDDSYDLSMFSRESRTFHVTIRKADPEAGIPEDVVWDMIDNWPPSFEARALACWNKILAADPEGDAQALQILSRAFGRPTEEIDRELTGRQTWRLIAFLGTDLLPGPKTTSPELSATSSGSSEDFTATAKSPAPAA